MSRSETTVERPVAAEREGCEECGGRLVPDGAEVVCADCGLVDREVSPPNVKARAGGQHKHFRNDGGDEAGDNPFNTDGGLGSFIGYEAIPYLDADDGRQFKRLRTRQKWERAKANGRNATAYNEVQRLGVALGLELATIETARRLFDEAQDARLLYGRSIEGVAAGCIVAAARIHDRALPFADVRPVARVGGQQVRSGYKAIVDDLGVPVPPPEPAKLVPRFASALGLGADVVTVAQRIATDGLKAVAGRKPAAVAAAAVYLASDARAVQADLADVAGVTPETLRSAMYALLEAADGIEGVCAGCGGAVLDGGCEFCAWYDGIHAIPPEFDLAWLADFSKVVADG